MRCISQIIAHSSVGLTAKRHQLSLEYDIVFDNYYSIAHFKALVKPFFSKNQNFFGCKIPAAETGSREVTLQNFSQRKNSDTILVGRNSYANAHGRSNDAGLQVSTLSCCRLCLYDSFHQSFEVLGQLVCAEGCLTDRAVDDVGLVETILDLTSLSLCNSLCYVRSYSTTPSGSASVHGDQAPYRDDQPDPSYPGMR